MPRADTWDPAQYTRFVVERDQPFHDLLDLLSPVPDGRVLVDLGCGDGRLTVLAHERLGAASTVGVDNSPAMLDAAAAADGVAFELGDLADWGRVEWEQQAPPSFDVVLANASLQWVGDHDAVLRRWRAALAPGGQLAVQVPANADHPSHLVLAEVVDELGLEVEPDPVAANVWKPEAYAALLDELGADAQHVRLQVYAHRLSDSAEVVEWVKGTTLTRVRRATDDEGYARFLERYRARLLAAIGDRAPYTYLFKRVLFWARYP